MLREIIYRDIPIRYEAEGEGTVLLFLHGYLESREIWKPFAQYFTSSYKTIIVDIPGHGDSGIWGEEHSMYDLAEVLKIILDTEYTRKAVILGHSMGGYVALAFASRFPDRTAALGLIHSTCFADSKEKRDNRDREIALVKCGKKQQIINVNIPRAFALDNLEKFERAVNRAKEIAQHSTDAGIIALLNGMKKREDHSETLKNLKVPVLLVRGMKDNYIPMEVYDRLKALAPDAEKIELTDSGHMGFIEEEDILASEMIKFLNRIR